MKRTKIIKKLSLTYWEIYSYKLRMAAATNDWQKAGGKKASRPLSKQVKKAAHVLKGIELSAKALGVSLEELQSAAEGARQKGV